MTNDFTRSQVNN